MASNFQRSRNVKINFVCFRHCRLNSTSTKPKIEEIGTAETEKIGRYDDGQCFIHKVFAYRGVVLCPWKAQLLDRDDKESPKVGTYYQVLIDERDHPHTRVQSEVGKFLAKSPKDNFNFAEAGLDQVPHQDIIPYTPTTDSPIKHKLFNKFFVVRPNKTEKSKKIVPKLALHDWKRKHLPWLYYTQVHKMMTDKIRVTAMSFYMGRKRVTHWWRYNIRIENLCNQPAILQGQRWGIYTGNGELQTVRGIGILGQLPVLSPDARAIQYSSHVTLLAPRGHMWGYYLVQKQPSKRTFLCPVPAFGLESTLYNDPIKTITNNS